MLSEKIRTSLHKHWQNQAETLLNRDGSSQKHLNGGHRIKQNPLLIRAIEEIRDGYFDLYYQKMQLVKALGNNSDPEIKQQIADIDYDLILHNKASFERLQKPYYGFDKQAAEAILKETNLKEIQADLNGLPKREAASITGTIIKRSINAFEIATKIEGFRRPEVPHVPLKARPEQVGRHRSAPRPQAETWQARIQEDTHNSEISP